MKYLLVFLIVALVLIQIVLEVGAQTYTEEDEIYEHDIFEISEMINEAEAGSDELLIVENDPQFIYVDGGKIDVLSGKFIAEGKLLKPVQN